jgi:hypothetical protein
MAVKPGGQTTAELLSWAKDVQVHAACDLTPLLLDQRQDPQALMGCMLAYAMIQEQVDEHRRSGGRGDLEMSAAYERIQADLLRHISTRMSVAYRTRGLSAGVERYADGVVKRFGIKGLWAFHEDAKAWRARAKALKNKRHETAGGDVVPTKDRKPVKRNPGKQPVKQQRRPGRGGTDTRHG